jgi:hypothetical protein
LERVAVPKSSSRRSLFRAQGVDRLAGVAPVTLGVLIVVVACGSNVEPDPRPRVTQTRTLGSWQGKGTMTLGDVESHSGRFRIRWETRDGDGAQIGTFRLTVRSAISGRPIEVVADHRGEGKGSVDFADLPRIYDFVVESANLTWSFSVEEDVVEK